MYITMLAIFLSLDFNFDVQLENRFTISGKHINGQFHGANTSSPFVFF